MDRTHASKRCRDGLAVAALGLGALLGTACFGPDNLTSLGYGDILSEDLQLVEFDASLDDLDGSMLTASRAFLFAPNGLPMVVVGGEASIDKGEDGVVSLVWVFQEPNKVKRKEDKIIAKQKADVAFFLFWYLDDEDFADGIPFCDSDPILLDSCDGKAKVDQQGPEGKFKVQCKDVVASTAAASFLDEDLGDLDCEEGSFSQEELADLIAMFLDEGKLEIRIKDETGEIVDEGDVPLTASLRL